MMRRRDREITNREEIEAILSQAPVCRLALNTGDGAPYIVPLCCGCEWLPDGRLRLVFHSAPVGRKLRLIQADPRVGFELDAGYELLPGVTACRYSCRFASVVGTGTANLLEDIDEKRSAVELMMRRLSGINPPIEENALAHIAVFEVVSETLSVKRNPS